MKTIAYRNVHDKTNWPRGAWDNEPDKEQWQDEATGFPCLIVRNQFGALCGYVGVSPGHPAYGSDYDGDVVRDIDVHGGLTFGRRCSSSALKDQAICHEVEAGEPDNVWWLGFDCAHAFDVSPGLSSIRAQIGVEHFDLGDIYRDWTYVKAEVARLALQLQTIAGV